MIYKRYVDNTFVLFSSKEHLQLLVGYMNKQHKFLKFRSEAENDSSFSFLDIKITRHNQQFKTSAYRKSTFSCAFTHYESYLDQTYKKSLIDTLLFGCFLICCGYTSFHLEVENLREILEKNSYPLEIIEPSIRSFLNKLHAPKKVIPTVPKKGVFIVLPCVCVSVFMLFHLLVSSCCTTSVIYLRRSDQRSFVVSIFWVLLPSSFISISESILFHLQRRKLQPFSYWRENDMI